MEAGLDRAAIEAGSGAPTGHRKVFLCVRLPKSGSASLARGLERAFAGRRIFYLPNTLDPDSRVSPLQRLRFWRARFQNLFRHYRSFSMKQACARIAREACPGDLVMGGHIDFRAASASLARPLGIITLLREPVTRAHSEYDYMRRSYLRKPRLKRFDASVLHKAAGRYDFDSYIDYLFDHRGVYGDIVCQYLGWESSEDMQAFFARNVFHCGVLERSDAFAAELTEKLGLPFSMPHENRLVSQRPEITRLQRAKLEQIYLRDLELYEWVSANER